MKSTGNRRTLAVPGGEALTLVQRLIDLHAEFEREYGAFHLETQRRHEELTSRRNDAVAEVMGRIGELSGIEGDITVPGSPWVLHLEFFEEHGQAFLKEVEPPAPDLERMPLDPKGTRH